MPRRPKTFYDRFNGEVVHFAGMPVKVGRIPVGNLTLWTENPRNQTSHVYQKVRRSQKEIEKTLEADVPKLMKSLEETRHNTDDADIVGLDTYVDAHGVVWEGNRRVVACRKLIRSGQDQFRNIFAIVFPDKPQAYKRLNELVNKRHLAGIKEWGSVNKALHAEKVLHSIRTQNPKMKKGASLRHAAFEVGWKPGYADQVFRTLKMWKRFVKVTGCNDTRKWSHVYEVANKHGRDARLLLPLIASGKIAGMRDLRAWPAIRENSAAMAIFKKRGFKEAREFVERYSGDDTAMVATLNKASAMVSRLLSNRKKPLIALVAAQSAKTKKVRRAFTSLQANVVLVANHFERMKEEMASQKRSHR